MVDEKVRAYAASVVTGVGEIPQSTKEPATIITIIQLLIPLISRLRCFNPNNDGYDAMSRLRAKAARNYDRTVVSVTSQLVRQSKKIAKERVRGVRDRGLKQQILDHWTLTDDEASAIAEHEVTKAMSTSGSLSDKTAELIDLF